VRTAVKGILQVRLSFENINVIQKVVGGKKAIWSGQEKLSFHIDHVVDSDRNRKLFHVPYTYDVLPIVNIDAVFAGCQRFNVTGIEATIYIPSF